MTRRGYTFLFICIALIQIGYAFLYRIEPMVDARAYDHIAQNIQTHGIYAEEAITDKFNIHVDPAISRIGPGYEYFLAGIYTIFGRHIWIVWLIQALLYAGAVTIMGYVSLKLMPEWASVGKKYSALLILLFFGIFIDAVQLNAMVMTEGLTLFLLSLIVFFLYSHMVTMSRVSFLSGAALGALMGITVLVRTNTIALIVPLLILFWYFYQKIGWRYILAFFLFFVAVQIPWVTRNEQLYRAFIFHNTAAGINLFVGNHPTTHGVFFTDFEDYQKIERAHTDPIALEHDLRQAFRKLFLEHPVRAFGILAQKSFLFFSLTKTSGFWFHYHGRVDHWLTVLASIVENAILLFSFFLFICMSLLRSYRDKKWVRWEMFVVLASAFLVAPSVATIISSRYRLLLLPAYIPALFYVVKEWRTWPARERILLLIPPTAILLFATVLDMALQLEKVLGRISAF